MIPGNVDPRAAIRRARDELTAFGGWWLQELRDTWSALQQRWAPGRSLHWVVDLSAERAVVRAANGQASDRWREIEVGDTGVLPTSQQLWPEGEPEQARADVILPEHAVLLCDLRLPPVRDREVAGAIELQLERVLPLPRERLYIDWSVTQKLPDQSRVVSVAVARRAYIDRLREGIRAWGWRVTSMTGARGEGKRRFNLLPPATHRISFAMGRREIVMACSALALCLIYGLIVAGQWWYERSSLAADIEHARKQMSDIAKLRAALDHDGRPIASLQKLMAMQSAGDALVALSVAVPRDTWVYQADITAPSSGPIVFSVEADTVTAAALLETLERSTELENVELIEAANAGIGTGRERVDLKANLQASYGK